MTGTYEVEDVRKMLAGSDELHRKAGVVRRVFRILNGLLEKQLYELDAGWKIRVSLPGNVTVGFEPMFSEPLDKVVVVWEEDGRKRAVEAKGDFPLHLIPALYERLRWVITEVAQSHPAIRGEIDFLVKHSPVDPATDPTV